MYNIIHQQINKKTIRIPKVKVIYYTNPSRKAFTTACDLL